MSDLELLTLQIIEGRITVEQARLIVIAKARALREMRAEQMRQYRAKVKAAGA